MDTNIAGFGSLMAALTQWWLFDSREIAVAQNGIEHFVFAVALKQLND